MSTTLFIIEKHSFKMYMTSNNKLNFSSVKNNLLLLFKMQGKIFKIIILLQDVSYLEKQCILKVLVGPKIPASSFGFHYWKIVIMITVMEAAVKKIYFLKKI